MAAKRKPENDNFVRRSSRARKNPTYFTENDFSNEKVVKAPLTSVVEAENEDSEDSEVDAEKCSLLFEALKNGRVAFNGIVNDYWKRGLKSKDAAIVEGLLLIFACCGAQSQVMTSAKELENMPNVMRKLIADIRSTSDATYLWVQRGAMAKKTVNNVNEFWKRMVKAGLLNDHVKCKEILNSILEMAVFLTSCNVRRIRHTATCIVYAIGLEMGNAYGSTEKKLANSKIGKNGALSQRTEKMLENKKMMEKRLEELQVLMELVIEDVFAMRYRDCAVEIRLSSMQFFNALLNDANTILLKDEYLKYVGWMLNDKAATVRLCALQTLCNCFSVQSNIGKLKAFTNKFLPRIVQMGRDIDTHTAIQALELLIAIDKSSLLDASVDTSSIEELIFDASEQNIRKVAAQFIVLQYDAFGVIDEKLSEDDVITRQYYTTQAIALVEFIEDHLNNMEQDNNATELLFQCVDLVVDGFWNSKDCPLLMEWEVMTNLLLDKDKTYELASRQQHILCRIMVASIKNCQKIPSLVSQKAEMHQHLENITNHFIVALPHLLRQYQAESNIAFLLVQIPTSFLLTSCAISEHSSNWEALIEQLLASLSVQSDESTINEIVNTFYHFQSVPKFIFENSINASIEKVKNDCWLAVENSVKDADLDSKVQWSKLFRLRCVLLKWNAIPENDALQAKLVCESIARMVSVYFEDLKQGNAHDQLDHLGAIECLKCFHLIVMWQAKPIFDHAKAIVSAESLDDAVAESFAKQGDDFVELFSMLISVLLAALSMNFKDSCDEVDISKLKLRSELPDSKIQTMSLIQAAAFILYTDIRACFNQGLNNTEYLAKFCWNPNDQFLCFVQAYVENLPTDHPCANAAVVSFGKSLLYNPESKGELAAMLGFWKENSVEFQDVARVFSKEIKSKSPTLYLEVQMIALRQQFNRILIMIEKSGEKAEESLHEIENLKILSKKLSTSLGVGKSNGLIREPLFRFLQEAIRFALESEENFLFADIVRPYLSHVGKRVVDRLHSQFDAKFQELPEEIVEAYSTQEKLSETERDPKYQAICALGSILQT